jgi:hypothetical protein
VSNLPQPSGAQTQEEFLDMLAYVLCTSSSSLVSDILWILGDIGMGAPPKLPFGYISPVNESVLWYTADGRPGGGGGLAAGLDDWTIPVALTVAFAPQQYVPPVTATPPFGSPLTAVALAAGGFPAATYAEQPTFRQAMATGEAIKATLRENITMGGEVATTRITESRYILVEIQGKQYRCMRISIATQQRRVRGH